MKHVLPCAISLLIAITSTKAQTTYQWNGSADSSWQNGSNWQSPGQPSFNTTVNGRLNVNNGANNQLDYTAAEGATIFAGGSVRGLVIGSGSNGQMTISGGSFSTAGSTTGDIIGNTGGTGSLIVNGGSYTTGASLSLSLTGSGSGTLTVNSGSAAIGGSLVLGNNTSAANSTVNLNGGTLSAWSISGGSAGTKVFNFNGGTLRVTSAGFTMSSLTAANIRNGGAIFDSNGLSFTVSQALVHSGIGGDAARDGGVTKNGTGTLTLSSQNSFNGNTVVNSGTLVLADKAQMKFEYVSGTFNSISGGGILNLSGDFVFDLAGAAAGNYAIIGSSILASTTFSGTFTVVGWTEVSNVWTSADGLATFSEASGVLSVVPEPMVAQLLALAGVAGLMLRRRRAAFHS